MKELAKQYTPAEVEDKIYSRWRESNYFNPDALPSWFSDEKFVISMPPPNATGVLHVGHSLGMTVEDAMIRFERMRGKRALWIPGTDHAAIATQSKVESIVMKEEGKTRYDLGREEMLTRIRAFVKDSQNTIRTQIAKMGASCDWSREAYTFSDELNQAVQKVFVDLYNSGLIYRGKRIVNWDPKLQTTVSDDEVEHTEEEGTLYYIQYGPFVVATSRPETKLGDTAVAVNPNDSRYSGYIGQTMSIPLTSNHSIEVKVIGSESVDPEFGSGALGVTPAHSQVDYDMATLNSIPMPQVIDLNGKMTAVAGPYVGMDLFECRKKFVADLDEAGLLVKKEKYTQSIARNSRGSGIIEPQIIEQWFVDVNKEVVDWKGKKQSFKQIMRNCIESGDTKIIPDRFENVYYHWIDNLRDWCISRQIWWGHSIPAWYSQEGGVRVQVENPGDGWAQDPDTLDTWFSSALWPFATLGWPDTDSSDLQKFFPTSVMETGYDILFFWVARMILMSSFVNGKTPFNTVYLHGLVRDEQGRKMSKSLGNILDPLEVIGEYGTDALRLALVIGTTPGNDVKVGKDKIASYRNFINKIWNISRFIFMQEGVVSADIKKVEVQSNADAWIFSRLNETIEAVTRYNEQYNFSLAGETLYQFLWDDFANWYLEIYKINEYPRNPALLRLVLETGLKLLHPLTPFVTEEIWSYIYGTDSKEAMLLVQKWPTQTKFSSNGFDEILFTQIKREIISIRELKSVGKMGTGIVDAQLDIDQKFTQDIILIEKLARIKITNLIHTSGMFRCSLSVDQEKLKEVRTKEITELEAYIVRLEQKLSNKAYVANAPADLIEKDRKILAETKEKIANLKS